MEVYGAKLFIYGGLILFCLSHYQFSMLNFVYDPYLFVGMAVIARIFEGFSFGVIGSTTYGVSSQELPPHEFDKYARANSTVYGIGEGLSLILGSLMFLIGGYMMPYFILGSVFIAFAAILYFSGALVEKDEPEEGLNSRGNSFEMDSSLMNKDQQTMTHKFAFSIPTVKYGCISIIISNCCQTYLDPIMALKLYQFGIMADMSGYIFIFYVMSYSLFGFLGGYICQYAEKRTLICLGYILGFIAFCLIGHEVILGFNSIYFIIFGLFLNGLSCVCHNVFATMYVKSELMVTALNHNFNKISVGGYFGGLKGSCNIIGSFFGPLISASLALRIGFEYTCISLAVFQALFFCVYYYMTKPTIKKMDGILELRKFSL